MKVSLNWINEYLDRPVTAEEASRALADLGLPVEDTAEVSLPSGADVMLNVEVTSNRSDCLSHVGVAREIAAGTGGTGRKLVMPDCTPAESESLDVDKLTRVENLDTALCPLYTARVLRNVKVGPSPQWMVDRLAAIGQDSINNVADITNYVQMELGQPLHAFDYDKLAEHRIVVRRAVPGEPGVPGECMAALNAETYEFSDKHLVIADAKHPVAIAGVMGGEASKVTEETTSVLLEAAMFDRVSVRNTVRGLKVMVKDSPGTESSYRFERGVDPIGVELASRRAAKLILDIAGGQLARGVVREGIAHPTPRAITMRIARCNALLGADLSPRDMLNLLDRLGLFPKLNEAGDAITCVVPTFRLDIEREVDLIEEVARTRGLDHVPVQEKVAIVTRGVQPEQAARRKLAEVLIAHGYHETVTFSFVSQKQGGAFLRDGEELVRVEHDRRKAEPFLRPSLLASLMVCRKTNQDVGNEGVRLFETAETWSRRGGAIVERSRLAMLADVDETASRAAAEAGNLALRVLRGAVAELVESLGGAGAEVSFEPTKDANFKAAANVLLGGETIGVIGVVAAAIAKLFDVHSALVAAELELEPLLALYPPQREVTALPRFPGIERDLSVVVDEATPWADIRTRIEAAQPAMLESLRFVDTYRGKPIPAGKKSVTLRMLFRDPQKTLRHEQVDPQVEAVVGRLKDELNAELRA